MSAKDGESYAKVNPQSAGVAVLSIWRTRSDEILLVLKKGSHLDKTITREKVVAALCIALGKTDLGD